MLNPKEHRHMRHCHESLKSHNTMTARDDFQVTAVFLNQTARYRFIWGCHKTYTQQIKRDIGKQLKYATLGQYVA